MGPGHAQGQGGPAAQVRIGFRGNDLAALEILDSFGQRSVLTFTKMELNAGVSPDAVPLQAAAGCGRAEAVALLSLRA